MATRLGGQTCTPLQIKMEPANGTMHSRGFGDTASTLPGFLCTSEDHGRRKLGLEFRFKWGSNKFVSLLAKRASPQKDEQADKRTFRSSWTKGTKHLLARTCFHFWQERARFKPQSCFLTSVENQHGWSPDDRTPCHCGFLV